MKVLLIGPVFFSYTKAIALELNRRGITCFAYNELHSKSILSKIFYRLGFDFLFKKGVLSHRLKIYDFIDSHKITDVLFVSPEIISTEYLMAIKHKAKVHLYMWDGMKNKSRVLPLLDLFATKSSFDMADCKEYKMRYIPLFAEKEYSGFSSEKEYDLCFCGTVHSNRPLWIKRFQGYANNNHLRIGLFLYYYSPLLLLIRLLVNRCCFVLFSKVAYTSFSKESIAELFRSSRAVIDIAHSNQNGLTARTFEALRSGAKLITNNENCRTLGDEYQSRIFIIDNINNQRKELLTFIKSDVAPLNKEQEYFLSIERFTDQVLESLND